MEENTYRNIPAVTKVLSCTELSDLIQKTGIGLVKLIANRVLDQIRSEIKLKKKTVPSFEKIIKKIKEEVSHVFLGGKRAINCTGILLHTGLGRAPLSDLATEFLEVGAGYNLVQADRSSGERSKREDFIEEIIKELTGAEATTVINNNAAATFIMLKELCDGREVIISRGHLVEIGGCYRMPDIMAASGCKMVEVGTTNKTHLLDYEKAITSNTSALLFVHQSNFRISGFASIPSLEELCELGKKHKIPVFADLGSGALVDLSKWGLERELTVEDCVKFGVSVCCYSGDKLIGGPQAGILSGEETLINRIRKNEFSRMFRSCKLTLRALEGTLLSFLNNKVSEEIPIYKFLSVSNKELKNRANKILSEISVDNAEVVMMDSYLGGGSTPDRAIQSYGFRIKHKQVEKFANYLRNQTPSIFTRTHDGAIYFDLRGVSDIEDTEIINSINNFQ